MAGRQPFAFPGWVDLLVYFPASDETGAITGQAFSIDGGTLG
jgi:hypothetical protein